MLEKVHLTNIFLEKHKCVREEDMIDYYKGNKALKMSIDDQIENFMASVTNRDCNFSKFSQRVRTQSEYEEYCNHAK